MKGSNADSAFGIKGYTMPETSRLQTFRPRTTKFSIYNVPHFIDQYTKNKSFLPGPKYDTVADWKLALKGRGQFTKNPRITHT